METFDNATVFIPNSQFLSNTFTNWTHNGRMVRREVAVGVAYGSDMALAMKLLTQAALEHPKVLRYPEPLVFFTDFAASSLNLLLRYWVANIDHGMTTMTDIRLRSTNCMRSTTSKSLSRSLTCISATRPLPRRKETEQAPTAGFNIRRTSRTRTTRRAPRNRPPTLTESLPAQPRVSGPASVPFIGDPHPALRPG